MKTEPQKEHQWLDQLVGEWTYEGECEMGPGQPRLKFAGTESIRSLGGLWVVAENKGTMPDGAPATMLMTIGFDPETQRYTGTWIGSMMPRLWVYDGEMDAAGKVLTLSAEGPSMKGDGSLANYEDIVEIVSPEHRVFRSRVQSDDGTWNEFMESHYRRKS